MAHLGNRGFVTDTEFQNFQRDSNVNDKIH